MYSSGSAIKSNDEETDIADTFSEDHEDSAQGKTEVKIAILGEPGVGKTTFREMIKHELATKYNFRFRKLPCLEKFSRNDYVNKVQLHDNDFYIIMGTNRVHENDIWLAKEISKNRKKFCYVRSKIDETLENNRRSKPKTHKEDEVLRKIRQYCQTNFHEEGLSSSMIFLISNHDPDKWECQRLKDVLVTEAPRAKDKSERRNAEKKVQSSSWLSWIIWPVNGFLLGRNRREKNHLFSCLSCFGSSGFLGL